MKTHNKSHELGLNGRQTQRKKNITNIFKILNTSTTICEQNCESSQVQPVKEKKKKEEYRLVNFVLLIGSISLISAYYFGCVITAKHRIILAHFSLHSMTGSQKIICPVFGVNGGKWEQVQHKIMFRFKFLIFQYRHKMCQEFITAEDEILQAMAVE